MRSRLPRVTQLAGALLGVALLASACGSSSSSQRHNGPTFEVTTESMGSLGTVLVNGQGYTLYLYVPDNGSSHSRCQGVCAVAWPPDLLPVGVSAPVAGPGVRKSLLGTTSRPNGAIQVTYNGWPLYRWANDTSPGEATGQGLYNLGGLWYVVDPQGNAVH